MMSESERQLLEHLLYRYKEKEIKEREFQAAVYTDKFKLLYQWIQDREISLLEFLDYLKKIKDII